MALTDAQKTAIRRHLGMNAASAALYPWVPTFFAVTDVLETLPPATEAKVTAILIRLDNIETAMGSALGRLKASEVGSITLNRREHDQLWGEVRRWRRELSTILGVPIVGGGGAVVVV